MRWHRPHTHGCNQERKQNAGPPVTTVCRATTQGARMNPGTLEWWKRAPLTGARGVFDSILRLLEVGAISRSKCMELQRYAERFSALRGEPPPRAPWGDLHWGDGMYAECERCGRECACVGPVKGDGPSPLCSACAEQDEWSKEANTLLASARACFSCGSQCRCVHVVEDDGELSCCKCARTTTDHSVRCPSCEGDTP